MKILQSDMKGEKRNSFFSVKKHRQISVDKVSAFLWRIIRGVIVTGICFVILYPIITKFSVSIMSESDLYDSTVKFIAKDFTLNNYIMAFEGMDYWKTFFNTLIFSSGISALQLIACMLTAYGFARFNFPGKKILFGCVIFSLIVPPQIIMLPMFMFFRFFDFLGIVEASTGKPINLIGTIFPFIIQALTCTGFKNGLYIYMLRQFFKGMPKELEEAAFVDGSGRIRTFIQIIVPSTVPMMVTVFLFGFVWQWTDYFYTSLYMPTAQVFSTQLGSLSRAVASQYENFGGNMTFISPAYNSMMNNTGVLLTIIPLLILYLFCQKYFVEGIERSGIVG